MLRDLVVLSFVAAAVMAVPINWDDDFAEYKDLIPEQLKEFITNLTEVEMEVLEEIGTNYADYMSRDAVIAVIKEYSPSLLEKMENISLLFREKFFALGDEAKAFVFEDVLKVRAAIMVGNKSILHELKLRIKSGVEKYSALSDAAKADLDEQFPIISFFKTDKFQKSLKKLLWHN